jgi:hypothetical protein
MCKSFSGRDLGSFGVREGIFPFLKKVVAKTRTLLDNGMRVSRTVKGGSMNWDLWHFLRSSELNAGQVCVGLPSRGDRK